MAMLNHSDVLYIDTTWDRIKNIPNYKHEFGTVLLVRINERSPELGQKFERLKKGPWKNSHAQLLVTMLDLMVHTLGPDMDTFAEQVFELGQRHAAYGVDSRDYPIFGSALLDTLEDFLEQQWDDKIGQAWKDLWKLVSWTMIDGSRQSSKNETEKIFF